MKNLSNSEKHGKLFQLLRQQSSSDLTSVRLCARERAMIDENDAAAFRETAILSWGTPSD